MNMATTIEVLPGETIPSNLIPRSEKKQLKLGPGLQHIPPSTIKATVAGSLGSDFRKNAIWVDYNSGRVCYTNLSPSHECFHFGKYVYFR
jgi:exosome complex component RRP40